MDTNNIHVRYADWFCKNKNEEHDEKLLRPHTVWDPLTLIESNFMLDLVKGMNYWLKVPQKELDLVLLISQMTYAKDCVIDDINDNTDIRNRSPTAHVAYGVPNTIMSIVYVTLTIIEKIAHDFKDPIEPLKLYLKDSMENLRGQWIEVEWSMNNTPPTEEEYRINAIRKTCGPCMNDILLLQHFSTNKTNYIDYIKLLCVFFQYHNDYINLTSKKYHDAKSFCEDITEGKFSFIIIHGIRSRPDDKRLLNIMKQKPADDETKRIAWNLLKEFGSLEYGRQTVTNMKEEIFRQTEALGGNPLMVNLIENHWNRW